MSKKRHRRPATQGTHAVPPARVIRRSIAGLPRQTRHGEVGEGWRPFKSRYRNVHDRQSTPQRRIPGAGCTRASVHR